MFGVKIKLKKYILFDEKIGEFPQFFGKSPQMMGKNTNISKKRIFRHSFYRTSKNFLERRITQKNGLRSLERVLATLKGSDSVN